MSDFRKTPKQTEATRLMSDKQEVLLEGGSRCFVGDQLVITKDGSVRIADIKEGNLVLSMNPNGIEEYKPVLMKHTFTDNKKRMVKLTLKNGETIEGTYDHVIFFNGGWHNLKHVIEYSMEIWKTIPGFSRYEASNQGRLRSTNYKNSGKTKLIKPALSQGYYKTMLQSDEGKYKTWNVHKWVAITWLGEADGLEINHIDGNKLNNSILNLEYCTKSENMLHAYKHGLEKPLRGESNPCAKLTEEQVTEIREYAKKHGKLKNRKNLAEKYGVTESHLKDIVSMRRGVWNHI